MNSRRINDEERLKNRPAIARRSVSTDTIQWNRPPLLVAIMKSKLTVCKQCDQCRARKVGCDRGPPCSNCVSSRLNCTHSAVASNPAPAKQRVLISAQYEQRIDEIAQGIDGIKLILQRLDLSPDIAYSKPSAVDQIVHADFVEPLTDDLTVSVSDNEPFVWSHSAHIIDLIRAVVQDRGLKNVGPDASETICSLKNLLLALERPNQVRDLALSKTKATKTNAQLSMPPLGAAVAVLKWAKEHKTFSRIEWICQILPLEIFAGVCQKVYFAVDDYNQAELIIANGYLSYVFFEHHAMSGLQKYQEYGQLCKENLQEALSQLPLLLPATMEMLNAIEESRATLAWTLASAAANISQTLKYNHAPSSSEDDNPLRAAQERLFWTVYKFERSLALRLGRSSNIHDSEITIPFKPDKTRSKRIGRIQGKIYEDLYSPAGLAVQDHERGFKASVLADELRSVMDETQSEINENTQVTSDSEVDPMRVMYLHFDRVCQSALLSQILRAVPTTEGSLSGASEECISIARQAVELHEQCLIGVNSLLVTRYINWAILHTPFVPFSILFSQAVQNLDVADLVLLERFAASLGPETGVYSESITHPYRLYKLLCQAARLYIDHNINLLSDDSILTQDSLRLFEFEHDESETPVVSNFNLEAGELQTFALGDWYHNNQQIMDLLENNMTF